MNNFKYIKNIAEGEGTILIYKQIGNSVDKKGNMTYGVNGTEFATEMLYLQKICDKITVRINSVGGSVLDGYAIAGSIYNSTVPVKTIIDGVAASTALWCAAAGNVGNRYSMDYATGMMHGSSGGDDKEMTALVDATIKTMLSNRSNKKPEEIDEMMKKETWLNANELLSNGLIDEVVSTGKKIKIKKAEGLFNLALIYNKLINTETMSKLNKLLNLSNTAEETEQEAAIVKLNTQLEEKTTEVQTLKNRLSVIETEKKAADDAAALALKTEATELVNKAVKEGKLTDKEAPQTIENASKDRASFSFISNFISKLGNGKEAKKIFDVSKVKNTGGVDDRSTWNYNDWEKKDVEGLKNMYVTDRETYNELLKTYKK